MGYAVVSACEELNIYESPRKDSVVIRTLEPDSIVATEWEVIDGFCRVWLVSGLEGFCLRESLNTVPTIEEG